jgi:hypothetical protein
MRLREFGLVLICGLLVAPAVAAPAQPFLKILTPRLSPDGKQVLLPVVYKRAGEKVTRGKLLIYSAASRMWNELPLPSGVVVTSAAFSPGGDQIALSTFCEDNCASGAKGGQIALAAVPSAGSGLNIRYLTHDDQHDRSNPRFSPDGKFIAYAVTKIFWQKQKGAYIRGFANIAVIASKGESGEKLLSSGAYLTVYPAGFSTAGDIVYTGIAPQGDIKAMVQARLKDTKEAPRWISMSIPYAIAPGGHDNRPRFEASFGDLDRPYLSCAADCGRAVFIARRDLSEKRYHYEVFLSENGVARQITNFNQTGSPLKFASLSSEGNHALVLNKGTPILIDLAMKVETPLPAPDIAAFTGIDRLN